MGVAAAPLTTDAEFLRRVYLDVLGRPPLPEETRAFFAAPSRGALIDRLLASPEYASFWTVKFEDWFRNHQLNSQGRAMGTFKEWIRDWLHEDKPYDRMVREILTSEGDSFLVPATAFWAPATDFMLKKFETNRAVPTVTRLFLGVRLECAECHNHPLENFTQDDFYGLSAFFARMRVKHGMGEYRRTWYLDDEGEVLHPVSKKTVAPKLLGGAVVTEEGFDRRAALAEWVTAKTNPYFARATVNRICEEWFSVEGAAPGDIELAHLPAFIEARCRHAGCIRAAIVCAVSAAETGGGGAAGFVVAGDGGGSFVYVAPEGDAGDGRVYAGWAGPVSGDVWLSAAGHFVRAGRGADAGADVAFDEREDHSGEGGGEGQHSERLGEDAGWGRGDGAV
jgi:hypothetical protein